MIIWVVYYGILSFFSPWPLSLAFSLTLGLKDQAILSLGLWSAACIRYFSNILVWIWIFFCSFGSGTLFSFVAVPIHRWSRLRCLVNPKVKLFFYSELFLFLARPLRRTSNLKKKSLEMTSNSSKPLFELFLSYWGHFSPLNPDPLPFFNPDPQLCVNTRNSQPLWYVSKYGII